MALSDLFGWNKKRLPPLLRLAVLPTSPLRSPLLAVLPAALPTSPPRSPPPAVLPVAPAISSKV